jgi:hypothetical protein
LTFANGQRIARGQQRAVAGMQQELVVYAGSRGAVVLGPCLQSDGLAANKQPTLPSWSKTIWVCTGEMALS